MLEVNIIAYCISSGRRPWKIGYDDQLYIFECKDLFIVIPGEQRLFEKLYKGPILSI